MHKSIKGVIFDLDGTLYHMKWYFRPLITIRVFPDILRLPRFLRERGKFAGKDMNSREELLNAICKSLSMIEKCSSHDIYNWITGVFYPAFTAIMPYFRNSRPGLENVLQTLRDRDIRRGVLSDFNNVEERLSGLDVDTSLFDIMASSEQSGALKPSSRPLRAIAEQWGLSPDEILVIGDRDDTDGKAAQAAGMMFRKISDNKKKTSDEYNWTELRHYLLNPA
jgi:putative hydrolase of the HAD superfamily